MYMREGEVASFVRASRTWAIFERYLIANLVSCRETYRKYSTPKVGAVSMSCGYLLTDLAVDCLGCSSEFRRH